MSFKPHEVDALLRAKLAGFAGDDDIFATDEYKKLCDLLCFMPESLARDIISGAVVYAELSMKNVSEITKSNIVKLVSGKNKAALAYYAEAVASIDSMDIDDKAKSTLLKQIFATIEPMTHDSDVNAVSIAGEFVGQAQKVSSSFSTMGGEEKRAVVTKIYQNCIGRMKNFWQRVEPEKFNGVIKALTEELSDGGLSDEDLIELSSRCATIFCESSREKILGIEKVLNEYKDFVLEQINNTPGLDPKVIAAFEELKYSGILKRAASIAKSLPEQVEKMSKFLQGWSIADIFEKEIDEKHKNSDLYKEFGAAKLDLGVQDMIWVMLKNPSLFGSSVDSSLVCVKNVKSAMMAAYGDGAKDIDYSLLLSRSNILKGMPSVDNYEEIARTIELLSSFVPATELARYLQNDMMILDASFEDIRETVKNIIKTSSVEEAGVKLSQLLKNGTFKKSVSAQKRERVSGDNVGSASKTTRDISVSMPLAFDAIDDIIVEFDISKLKLILGDDFDAWAKKYETSNIDKKKLSAVIERTKGNAILAELASERKPNSVLIDGDKFQAFLHEKEHRNVNVIEMLWQLQRNIDAATSLVKKFTLDPDKYTHRDVVFIASTNYFKVATERDEIYDSLGDRIPIEISEAVDYARRLIDDSFETLTHDFTSFVKADSKYLRTYIAELEEQREAITKFIESHSFLGIEEGESIEESRLRLIEDLERERAKYKGLVSSQELIKSLRKQKGIALNEERRNPSTDQEQRPLGDNYSFDSVMSQRELEYSILAEIDKLDLDFEKNNANMAVILNKIRNLEAKLDELARLASNDSVVAAKRAKLEKILSRLAHAIRIKESVDDNNSESNI